MTTADTPLALLDGDDLVATYEAILDGQIKVVGWGAVASFPYLVMQSPFPFDYLVDADERLWGTTICDVAIRPPDVLATESPERVVVVVLPFYSEPAVRQILARLAGYGRYRAITPFNPELDTDLVRGLLERRADRPVTPPVRRMREAVAAVPYAGLGDLLRDLRAKLAPAQPPVPRRIRLIIGALQPGGAERQICYLAAGLKERGWDVSLLAFAPTLPGVEHYIAILERAGVPLVVMPTPREIFRDLEHHPDILDTVRVLQPLLRPLPFHVIHWVVTAYQWFVDERPEVAIAYLDTVNVSAGIGALLAGVGHILVSGRNVHPGNFPNHYGRAIAWMKAFYITLGTFPEFHLSANSAAGARSYAAWLGLPVSAVATVPNGIPSEAAEPPSAEAIAARRSEFGVADGTPLIVGVFRLAVEKQPLLFVDVIRHLRDGGVRFRAVLAGDGPLGDAVRDAVAQAGLENHLHVLGVREDVRAVMGAADLVLHVARAEGLPNVLMEAQFLGKPIVAARAEGTEEVLAAVHHAHTAGLEDAAGLAAACRAVLADLPAATRAAAQASAWVAERFSIARLVANTLAAAGVDDGPRR